MIESEQAYTIGVVCIRLDLLTNLLMKMEIKIISKLKKVLKIKKGLNDETSYTRSIISKQKVEKLKKYAIGEEMKKVRDKHMLNQLEKEI